MPSRRQVENCEHHRPDFLVDGWFGFIKRLTFSLTMILLMAFGAMVLLEGVYF